ncbi:HAMP domain-containing histidine kinase [Synechococcus sp. AH-551-E05]|jgi:signal transduction histidine kinase|nr:HAMP domain-containing sensor histidine kinase [Synechococcus sp. AH-551-E05]MDB4651127.1 HAMP domain-containing histidine kinase [Synechococcus sp. AH-551-E05]MDC0302960.1 HAMP domain-containing histidine kinase [bacterium]
MQLTKRFLDFADQQLNPLVSLMGFTHLGLYLSAPPEHSGPPLILMKQWSSSSRALPAADVDPELRQASEERRWYPLQDAGLILGALRAELDPGLSWTADLEEEMRRCALAISHALGRDLECLQLQDELNQQRNQLKTLVHQLRNPLAALRTYAQLMMRRLEPDSAHISLVDGILTEQYQLGRYIDAIETLGQNSLPNGPDPATAYLLPPNAAPQSESLQELLLPLIDRASATASLQGRPWHCSSQWPAWSSRPAGDGSTAEIVANLLENAFRYSPPGSAIGLALLPDGLCVWDSGPPISSEERQLIFQRGERGTSSHDRPGTGLGLALARALAERNGGQLTLSVEPWQIQPNLPKQGNAFRLSWPQPALPAAAE